MLNAAPAGQVLAPGWYNRFRVWGNATFIPKPSVHDPKGSVMNPVMANDGQKNQGGSMPPSGGRYTFAAGSRPLPGYTIMRAVGRGGFSEVYYAVSDAGKEVALKHILRNVEVERRGVIQCMNLKSPHLVTIHDLRTNDEGDTFVIMEYLSGPSLATILEQHPNGLPLVEVQRWLEGLVAGVAYLHDHRIVHRDLKPANLFLEDGVVKIADYGLSKAISGSRNAGHSQSVGTCHYMAPEIGSGRYNKPIDIYAIGVILHELITGRVPFDGESVQEVLMKHLTSRPDLTALPEPYRSLAGKALAKDPAHRPASVTDLLPVNGSDPQKVKQGFASSFKATAPKLEPVVPPVRKPERANATPIAAIAEQIFYYIRPEMVPPGYVGRPATGWFHWNWPEARPRRGWLGGKRAAYQTTSTNLVTIEAPPQPQLPARRMRVAELATSMLMAAVFALVAATLGAPFIEGPVFGSMLKDRSFLLVQFFGITLLASWAIMVPAKLWESREVAPLVKRISYLGIGWFLGLGLGKLLVYLGADGLEHTVSSLNHRLIIDVDPVPGSPLPFKFAWFFAVALALPRIWKLVERDRPKRVRIWPVTAAGLVALITSGLIFDQPALAASIFVAAGIVQLASPWSAEAVRYNRFMARLNKLSNAG